MQICNVEKYLELIDDLKYRKIIRSKNIYQALKRIKRIDFVLPGSEAEAHLNEPLPIAQGQTISQPQTVAFMLELLQVRNGDRVLDVGSGSGWSVALLSELAGESGQVIGLERIKELRDFAEANIAKYNFIKSGRAKIINGDGYLGLSDAAPFDKIIVAAAAASIPAALKEQLRIGGRLVMPVGSQTFGQDITVIKKRKENEFEETRYPGFIFVPLVKD